MVMVIPTTKSIEPIQIQFMKGFILMFTGAVVPLSPVKEAKISSVRLLSIITLFASPFLKISFLAVP